MSKRPSIIEPILRNQSNYYSDGYHLNDGYCVYMFENMVNGKRYIGKANNFWKRFNGHFNDAQKSGKPIYKSIRKYGWDKFYINILQSFSSEIEAFITEIELIQKYKTNINKYGIDYGYNLTDGGEGVSGYKWNIEQIENCHLSILSIEKVIQIYNDFINNKSVSEIKQKYNVDKATINRILRGETWSDLGLISLIRKPGAQFTEQKVIEIYNTFINTNITMDELALMFNVAKSTIHRILIGKTWTNLKLDTDKSSNLIKQRNLLDKSIRMQGDKCNRSKLEKEDVLKIRELWNTKDYSKSQLSKLFKVSRRTIKLIVENKSWRHI